MRRLRDLMEPEDFAKIVGEEKKEKDSHLESITTAFANIVDDAALLKDGEFRAGQAQALSKLNAVG